MIKLISTNTRNDLEETIARLEGKIGDLTLFKQIADQLPINLMAVDLETFKIFYANSATVNSLKEISHVLPIEAGNLIGTSIDTFHKTPEFQRGILGNPENLPHTTDIYVRGLVLELNLSALYDQHGKYSAVMVEWKVLKEYGSLKEFVASVLEMSATSTESS